MIHPRRWLLILLVSALFSAGCVQHVFQAIMLGAEIGAAIHDADERKDRDAANQLVLQRANRVIYQFVTRGPAASTAQTTYRSGCVERTCGIDSYGRSCGVCEATGVTESGIAHRRIGLGLGERYPNDDSRVTFHFIERDSAGRQIASTYATKNTVTLPVNRLIDGLREGVQMMRKAEKRLFLIPADLVNRSALMPINKGGHYTFEVQLFAFSSPR